ncbi:hypothetical protein [Ferdinandcohnia sp. Marseille-Q9671]
MNEFLNRIRQPKVSSLTKKWLFSTLVFIAGILLGLISKILDETASNLLPYFLEVLDLRNFFSRMGIWIFLGALLSVYSKSPVRSAINVLLFFVGMVGSYYLYTVIVAGFFPKSYMMIWIILTILSPFLAFVCWYSKGKGLLAIFLSSIIFMVISRQTFVFGFWYFDMIHPLEFLLWVVTIFVLYQTPKQIIKVVSIGLLLFFLTSQTYVFWGML